MDSRDALINERRALVRKQAAQLERQAAQIAELELKLAKALKDSSTSSKPPLSDIAKPKPKKKPEPPKKPRRGGQPGHEQQIRQCVIDRRITQGARTQRNGRSCFAQTPPASSSLDAHRQLLRSVQQSQWL